MGTGWVLRPYRSYSRTVHLSIRHPPQLSPSATAQVQPSRLARPRLGCPAAMAGMPQLPHDGLLSATPQGQGLPGLGGCVGLAACRDLQRTFEALGGGNSADEDAEDAGGSTAACADHIISMRAEGTRRGVGSGGVELEQWLRMAPLMGLADVVTAGTTFAMLAEPPQTASASVAAIPFRTFAKYVERVGAKCTPGAELVGGLGSSATADELLSEAVAQHYHAAQRGGSRAVQAGVC
jgi:hypothetical protein